jgi:alkaline phosphatase D
MRDVTRRDLLEKAAVATAGGLLVPRVAAYGKSPRVSRLLREGAFGHGVASGHPTRTAATVWTRVDGIERAGFVELEVSQDADFRRVLRRERVRVAPVRDFTVHHRIRGLRPGERYYYRFSHPGEDSAVGRFATLRPIDSREPVRIGFFSCQRWQDGYYTAHAGLAQEPDLDVVVSLGDYVYESNASSALDGRGDQSSRSAHGQTETLADYRAKYALYRSDPNLQAMHAAHPVMAEWDDHEVENNWAGHNPGTTKASDRTIDFETRKRNGKFAFFEWLPVERVRGDADRFRIYRSLPLGANAELVLLDTRTFRDAQPCGGDAGELGEGCTDAERFAPGRTILGEAQRTWLVDRLTRSPSAWKVVANQVMIMGYDGLPRMSTGLDKWDGYAAERRDVLTALHDRGVKDVTFVTGDVHDFYAGVVTTTGRLDGVPVATEFVGGAITSASSLTAPDRATAEVQHLLDVSNPHWRFSNFVDKGYGVLEARPDELRVEFRAPQTVGERTSPVRTLARFRVARGSTIVERMA